MLGLLHSADIFGCQGHGGLCWQTWAALVLHGAAEASAAVLFSSREKLIFPEEKQGGKHRGLEGRGVQVTHTVRSKFCAKRASLLESQQLWAPLVSCQTKAPSPFVAGRVPVVNSTQGAVCISFTSHPQHHQVSLMSLLKLSCNPLELLQQALIR